MSNGKIIRKHDHYEVYVNGKFYCSTDTLTEAAEELDRVRWKEEAQWAYAMSAVNQVV